MKLLVVISDANGRHLEYQMTGIFNPPHIRTVEIELTNEQLEQIGLRKIGVDRGRDIYENIREVALLNE